MKYAVIKNGAIMSVNEGAECPFNAIELTEDQYNDLLSGWTWVDGVFFAPVPPVILPPTKDQQIDVMLSNKGVSRLLVQLTIEVSEDKAKALAPSYGLTEAQAIAYAYSKNKTYRECKDLETAIRAIETAP